MEEVRAVSKYIRMSPRKLRRVADLIRGKNAMHTLTVLDFMTYSAAKVVKNALRSAISNAEMKSIDIGSLNIVRIFVDEGMTLKRIRPRAQGRAYPRKKRTSTVTVVLG